jgi:glycosyltransferase involved in cell wall biosynthesis
MSPSVSVVIPLYQAAAYVSETLDSVAAQTAPPAEVIVVDDGSRDGGAEVARAHPLGPVVLSQSNAGPAAARNAGIRAAGGELIAFLDADDLWHPEKLARQLEVFRMAPDLGLVSCHAEGFWEEGGQRHARWREPYARALGVRDLLLDNRVQTLTAVAPRRVLEAVGGFDEHPDLIGTEDYNLWLRIAARFPLHYVRANLASYRLRSDSLVGHDWTRFVELGNRSVAHALRDQPNLSRAEFDMSPRRFLRWRTLRLVHTSIGDDAVSWRQRAWALRRFCLGNPMDALLEA